jgi:hypothetical protein
MAKFPHYFDATPENLGSKFLLIFDPERPATDELNLRPNPSKRRPLPARLRRYFDFFAAKGGKRRRLLWLIFIYLRRCGSAENRA